MNLRTRTLLAVAGPPLVLLTLFSALVAWRVRADRVSDLDSVLEAVGAGLAARVERDEGAWEFAATPAGPTDLSEVIRGYRISGPEGGVIAEKGALEGRVWQGDFLVEDDPGPGDPEEEDHTEQTVPQVRIRVEVAGDTAAIDADMAALLRLMGGTGLGLSGLALALGAWLSRRIVDAADHQRLADRYSQQARFTADASHELRTPLTVVRTEAEVALRRERTPAEYRAALEGVVESAGRMQEILEGLLLLARADAGVAIQREPVNLMALASATVPAAVTVAGATADVDGDPRLLRIVIQNLVGNAVRHAPGGTVRVEGAMEGGIARLTVSDDGEGIPADALPHVFDRFYRVDAARSRDRGGSGLGLSIVATVVSLHQGTVAIDSVRGGGTSVHVRIPSGSLQPTGRE